MPHPAHPAPLSPRDARRAGAVPHARATRGYRFTLLALALSATACADPSRSLLPVEAAPTTSEHPAGAQWEGERTLTVGGTTILARVARPAAVTASPTVVLISGLDVPLPGWDLVQPSLGVASVTFAYDRAGVGGSGAITGARPSSAVARELRQALDVAGLRPPFVLVAHSIGGVHARVFAGRYPRDVAGLVFLDAMHEDDLASVPDAWIPFIAEAQLFPGAAAEVLAQRQSEAEVRAVTIPDVPVAVVTSMQGDPDARAIAWARQGEWARQVTQGVQVASPAGHLLPIEAPKTVVEATGWVLRRARPSR